MDLYHHDYTLEKVAGARMREARAHAARQGFTELVARLPEEAAMTTGVRDVIHAFIAAWNAHSPTAVRNVFADDGRLCDPAAPDGLAGRAIGASVQRTLDRIPDVSFALTSVVASDDGRAAFEWRMSGTAVTPDGRTVSVLLDGCDICQVRDGKIVELRGYFDRAGIMEQLGAC